jgi:glutathione peroxidase
VQQALDVGRRRPIEKPVTKNLFSIPLVTIEGEKTSLEQYRGKVLLVVNVASACGFTPQYAGLEAVWRKYRDQGLVVLGFPCNQFGKQEPGCDTEIQRFTKDEYAVSFPLFSKIDVNGPGTHPLYALLKKRARRLLGTEAIKWNFTKFLIDRRGEQITRFATTTTPAALEPEIEELLTRG